MAERFPPSPQKMVAKYKCPECGAKWKSKNSQGGPKQCNQCLGDLILPYKFRPMKPKDHVKRRKRIGRQFGDFTCICGKGWKSANAWENVWQQCKSCKTRVYPTNLRPLLYSGTQSGHKPHETEHCGKCKELGYNCRNYVALAAENDIDDDNDNDDDDDAESVFSEASTTSSSSVNDLDLEEEGVTPVPSDDEEELGKRLDKVLKF